MMKILILIITLFIVSCNKTENRKPAKQYKYLIWVGTSAFSTGYDTDSYKLTNETVTFTTKGLVKKIVPICQILSIDEKSKTN